MNYNFETQAGLISLNVLNTKKPVEELLTFACRQNPKRSFMLVSKVLGRYVPTKPNVMRDVYDSLSESLGEDYSTYVVSLAEAATGLGAGVADSLARDQQESVYFQHTTRHKLNRPLWFCVDEAHSHAVDHMFYAPQAVLLEGIVQSKRLVIVDDEITTGRTIKLLITRLLKHLMNIEEIVIISLVNLVDKKQSLSITDFNIPVRYVSLMEAQISMAKKESFKPQLPDNADTGLCESLSSDQLGRCAMLMPYSGHLPSIESSKEMTIIANGEHQYIPFLIAEKHQQAGCDVLYQSINRSPLLLGESIEKKLSFAFDNTNVEHYLYNFEQGNRDVYVLLENESARETHEFASKYPLTKYEALK
ncbi:MAG: pyrimidine operon attenuation protein/uracil phosphoribosyltransferase [Psychromonas sp.]|jgi:pyrimidine operon attenuation protein/uracil phosphoribosyltransferase|uniref:phosphoribosyltransferase domain-containing protein n=1 Tax=Psychromonas sp. TaxID=1884585 RepID=UPI0039E4473A